LLAYHAIVRCLRVIVRRDAVLPIPETFLYTISNIQRGIMNSLTGNAALAMQRCLKEVWGLLSAALAQSQARPTLDD
jgi:hypothetical protein